MTTLQDRVEIIASMPHRRRWTASEKVRMVEETFEPGMLRAKMRVLPATHSAVGRAVSNFSVRVEKQDDWFASNKFHLLPTDRKFGLAPATSAWASRMLAPSAIARNCIDFTNIAE